MKHFSHIIVAYDGSEEGAKVIDYGAQVANAFHGAKMTVIHVGNERREEVMIGNAPSSITSGMYSDPIQSMNVIEGERALGDRANETHEVVKNSVMNAEANARRLLSGYNVKAAVEILEGNAPESICEYAKHHDGDLIIVGNSEKSGIEKFFLGSTSSSVAKNASCAVLIAK
ncbi:universal stress protein [Bacillus massiliglaciei]|uniref:universal stress protein n=1 Tax=Bacillus massiliglaciei TaxID=1816693 RepID=UPI000DA61E1A|nr:universal stress protein [Bacillus massiliglaciei]